MYSIRLVVGARSLVLNGADVSGAVRGARLLPVNGPAQTVEEPVEVVLEGSPAEIESALEAMGRLISAARAGANGATNHWGYLEVRPSADGQTWRSKLLDGWPVFRDAGAGQRARGRNGVTLVLVRENWWEGEEVCLPLSNPHGTAVVDGLTVYNHYDSAHANYAHVSGASLSGDLPGAARLEYAPATSETGTLWVGMNQNSDPQNLWVTYGSEVTDPGNGVTPTTFNSVLSASEGSWKRFAWNGAGVIVVASWAMFALQLERMGGRPFRGVLRFYNQVNEANLWAWWRVLYRGSQSSEVVWEGPGSYLSTELALQDLPALFLPPWGVLAGQYPPGLTLELAVQAGSAGAHQLDLDDLTLLPMDGWRKYVPVIVQAGGAGLRDDTERDHVQSLMVAMQSHAAEGPGYWLEPGKDARFTFVLGQRLLANIAVTAVVKIFYRARRRGL